MATAYTLTLPTGDEGPGTQPAPYKLTCGHWHRTPSAASGCQIEGGRVRALPPVAVVARDTRDGATRKLNRLEWRQMSTE